MKKITTFLLLTAMALFVSGIVWMTVLSFIHIDTVFTMRLRLSVFWKPAVLMLSAIPFYFAGKMYQFNK